MMSNKDDSDVIVLRLPVHVVKTIKRIAKEAQATENQVITILLLLACLKLDIDIKKPKKAKKQAVKNPDNETPSENYPPIG
jgi:hypothetical protein